MSRHMVRIAIPLGVLVIVIGTLIGGFDGFVSALIGVGVVTLNFALTGLFIGRASENSPIAAMVVALGSFFVILLALTLFVVLAHNAKWLNLRIFGISMIALHLVVSGLEARRVSGRMAYSGIFPSKKETK
ncbi:hypothetical protein AXFE_18890 [Acidithrix ferrooxidans]|uniref:Uncharacterized protein n=2 Tax=Acidimicrobiaceae TaxID=84994 RepID=A0A0D8HJI9_9ACTN|nr:hypothetical protein AXFE_18890 [Acidithrix ferrooxidans]